MNSVTQYAASDEQTDRQSEQWIEEILNGSTEAFERFYHRHASLVFHIALKMTGDRMEAEDICHDVFMELFHKWDQYDHRRGSIEAWLAVKTKSRSLDRLRRINRYRMHSWDEVGLEERMNGQVPSSEETVLRRMQQESVRHALRRIPSAQREALYGAYYAEQTHQELAEQLKRPLGSIKSMIRYGLNNMKKQLDVRAWLEQPEGGAKNEP